MRPRKVSDQKILSIAKECFLSQGPSVSTHYIARQIGVSQATLFKRFGSKEQLMKEALMLPIQKHCILDVLTEQADFNDPKSQFKRIAKRMIDFFNDMVPCASMMHSAAILPFEPTQLCAEEPLPILGRKAFQSWLEQLQSYGIFRADLDCEVASIALLGSFTSLAFRKHVLHDTKLACSNDAFVHGLVEILWRGLLSKTAEDNEMCTKSRVESGLEVKQTESSQ